MNTAARPAWELRSLRKAAWLAALVFVGYIGLRFFGEAALRYGVFSETSYGPYWASRGWLVAHLLGGSLALLVGPFQFFSGFRRRHQTVHRWTGRLYLAGVTLGAVVSFVLAARTPIGPSWSVGLVLLACVWLTTTGMAFLMIAVYRDVKAHREWMIRSYVITFSFANFRWLEALPLFPDMPFSERFATIGYMAWIVPLIVTEIVLQFTNLRERDRARIARTMS